MNPKGKFPVWSVILLGKPSKTKGKEPSKIKEFHVIYFWWFFFIHFGVVPEDHSWIFLHVIYRSIAYAFPCFLSFRYWKWEKVLLSTRERVPCSHLIKWRTKSSFCFFLFLFIRPVSVLNALTDSKESIMKRALRPGITGITA